MVKNEEEGDPSQETITFLYKFSMVNFLLLLFVETETITFLYKFSMVNFLLLLFVETGLHGGE